MENNKRISPEEYERRSKDNFGNKLEIGDTVVYGIFYSGDLYKAFVVGFTRDFIILKSDLNNPWKFYVSRSKVCKI